ncbi:hypothetical protein ACGC1H_006604 [Rhizoctonia solani]
MTGSAFLCVTEHTSFSSPAGGPCWAQASCRLLGRCRIADVTPAILLALFMRSSSSKLASVLVHLVFLGITWVFWTAGAASITASMGGGINCSRVAEQVVYCNQLNALMGFAWVEWVLATFAIFVVIVCAIRSARRGDGTRGALVVD